MRSHILLEDLKIYAYHGVLPEENQIGTEFLVNVKLEVDLSKAAESDDLKDTINYAEVNRLIHEQMQISSKLLEHVAGRIIKTIKKEFPQILKIKVKITKIQPPMNAELKGVSVELEDSFEG